LATHPVVAFLQTFFGGKAGNNLLALKKLFFILFLAAVFFEFLELCFAFLPMFAPEAALGVIIAVVQDRTFGRLFKNFVSQVDARKKPPCVISF
jgi:TRAP-type mannitol/chloroaromatic compound transport system permease large subunit